MEKSIKLVKEEDKEVKTLTGTLFSTLAAPAGAGLAGGGGSASVGDLQKGKTFKSNIKEGTYLRLVRGLSWSLAWRNSWGDLRVLGSGLGSGLWSGVRCDRMLREACE